MKHDSNAILVQQLLDSGSLIGPVSYMGTVMHKGGGVTATGFTNHMSQPREDGAVQLDCVAGTYLEDAWHFPHEALSTFRLNDAQKRNYAASLAKAALAKNGVLAEIVTDNGKHIESQDAYAWPAPDTTQHPPYAGIPILEIQKHMDAEALAEDN